MLMEFERVRLPAVAPGAVILAGGRPGRPGERVFGAFLDGDDLEASGAEARALAMVGEVSLVPDEIAAAERNTARVLASILPTPMV